MNLIKSQIEEPLFATRTGTGDRRIEVKVRVNNSHTIFLFYYKYLGNFRCQILTNNKVLG